MGILGLSMRRTDLFGIVVIAGVLYVAGQYVASEPMRAAQEVEANREITVSGTGEIQARPDIASLSLGMTTGVQPDAETALRLLSKQFDSIVSAVKASGIGEEDIKTTNLSVRPVYDYTDGRQNIRGYEASESLKLTIRDLGSIGDVLARTTLEGVNQVGGISFDIDDPDDLQAQAQDKAIADAQNNAKQLAEALGVRLGDVKSFSASSGDISPPPVFARAQLSEEVGFAGPPVESGSQDVVVNVSVTYEIR